MPRTLNQIMASARPLLELFNDRLASEGAAVPVYVAGSGYEVSVMYALMMMIDQQAELLKQVKLLNDHLRALGR